VSPRATGPIVGLWTGRRAEVTIRGRYRRHRKKTGQPSAQESARARPQ
jgi:hypothetical protein